MGDPGVDTSKKDDSDSDTDSCETVCEMESSKETNETSSNNDTPVSKKIGHRRVHNGGTSYKKINTLQIMESVQLGIQRSVGSLASQPERDVLMVDFMTVESTSFTSEKSEISSDSKPEFIFKTYAPVAFRHLRDLFGIEPDDFVASFCQAPLLELPSPGASGSVFYLTQNDDFITKTVQHREADFLQKLLPGYFLNLSQNPHTLLPKFFGLYCYKRNSTNVRLLVMNNVLPSNIKIHQKYDLKGSKIKRKASKAELQKASPTYKDLDFVEHHPSGLYLKAEIYKNLVKSIERDCRVLESFQIMDYSLLIGIHKVDQTVNRKIEENLVKEEETNIPSGDGSYKHSEIEVHLNGTEAQSNPQSSNELVETSRDSKGKSESVQKNKYRNISLTGIPARQADGEKLLLFIGIIDILQSYRLKKKVEHFCKSILHNSDEISVHNPAFYASRFEDFMAKRVFNSLPTSPKIKKKNPPLLKPVDKQLENQ